MHISLRKRKTNYQKLFLITLPIILMALILLRQGFVHPKQNIITVVFPTITLVPTSTPTPTLIPTPTSTPTPTLIPTSTPTPTAIPTTFPATSFESYFDQYSNQYQVSKELLKKIAQCESGMNPGAVNGPYGGMYQFMTETWQVTRNQMGADSNPDLRFNAEESIKTAAFKIANGGQMAWKNCL